MKNTAIIALCGLLALASCEQPTSSQGATSSGGPVVAVSLQRASMTINLGSKYTFAIAFTPSNPTNSQTTWASSDTGAVTVTNGQIEAVGVGTSTVTVTTDDGAKQSSCVVTVVEHLTINEIVTASYTNYPIGIEIFNPTASSQNLNQYQLKVSARTNDASTYPSFGVTTFSLPNLTIPAGGYVVVRSKLSADMESGGKTIYLDDGAGTPHYPWFSPSGGFVELLKSGATEDFVRWGNDSTAPTTSGWPVFGSISTFPTGDAGIGYAYARSANADNATAASDWTLRAWNTMGGANDVTSDADADGDGIPDSSESNSSSKFAGLPLYTWGARTGQKDVFIHVDYMVNGSVGATDVGIIPRKAALDKIVAAFLAKGIHVHFDVGDLFAASFDPANYNLDATSHAVAYQASATLGKATGYANAYRYKTMSMAAAKGRVFFYMLFANSQNADGSGGSSGLADIRGNTSLVTLGNWGLSTSTTALTNKLENFQASTAMHEFGHNLGLRHGGDENTNYKPNYFSIMNYLYQLDGLPTIGVDDGSRYYAGYSASTVVTENSVYDSIANRNNWTTNGPQTTGFKIDFSDGTGGAIDENHVDETQGLRRSGSLAIDFDESGTANGTDLIINLRYILDESLSVAPTRTTLRDFNDWGSISSVFQRQGSGFFFGMPSIFRSIDSVRVSQIRSVFDNPNPDRSTPCADPFRTPKR